MRIIVLAGAFAVVIGGTVLLAEADHFPWPVFLALIAVALGLAGYLFRKRRVRHPEASEVLPTEERKDR